MIRPQDLIQSLEAQGITFSTGVPDSYLAPLCRELVRKGNRHVTAANEGCAVGLAAGHYLGSGQPALVYLQNSGLGNALNPLVSLVSPEVFGIPMVLFVGWRGKPGVKDEPQHVLQGQITPELLDVCGIRYLLWEPDHQPWRDELAELVRYAKEQKTPVAVLMAKGVFESQPPAPNPEPVPGRFTRQDALEVVLDTLTGFDFVATTGYTSRVLMELRSRRGEDPRQDFLVVGSMGHALSIATGIALSRPDRMVCCLDGDGAALMHLGALAAAGAAGCANLVHLVVNNRCHDSVGGFPTCHPALELVPVARSLGYRNALGARGREPLESLLTGLDVRGGPLFIEVLVDVEPLGSLSRPAFTPKDNLKAFQKRLEAASKESVGV